MVVGLILKVNQPFLRLTVYFNRYNDGAGVDLIGLFLIIQLALSLQTLHGKQCQIHQADKLVISSGIHAVVCFQIILVSFLDRSLIKALVKADILQLCGERGVTAVVAPVGIQHTDLRHGWIPLLLTSEIILNMEEILEGHCKVQ